MKKVIFLLVCLLVYLVHGKTQQQQAVLEDVADWKDFKKLLRTKTNVLVLFLNPDGSRVANEVQRVFRETAAAVRGTGTMLLIDCTQTERKKLCKKLKVSNPQPYVLKHYKDGDFHKDYDRQLTSSSMETFMRDPAGDLPWEEDPAGSHVLHFTNYTGFQRHLRKDLRPMLLMVYVPWCGYCKRLKPDFGKAATQLKQEGEHVLAAMDVERTENAAARRAYNVTGFPTMLYFARGQLSQVYEGENNEAAIVAFMRDPQAAPVAKAQEADWSADTSSEIVHLTAQGFVPALQEESSVLVMFYAPWCGHCKRLKPEWERAAVLMKERQVPGVLAALDATKETAIGEKYQIKGYPTLKYFSHGELKFDVNLRDAEKIVEFMREPSEPPPPPPPETPWEEEADAEAVFFLTEQDFASTLKRKKHALVMFYAPWCGHCKSTKPEFTAAAQSLQDDPRIAFVAVDCTRQTKLCAQYEVRGYPSIKYFSYLKTQYDYNGGRLRKDFVAFMTSSERDTANKQQQHNEL